MRWPTAVTVVFGALCVATVGSSLAAAGTPSTTPPAKPAMQVPFPLEASTGKLQPLIPIPSGCAAPPAAVAVFDAKLVANSSTAARFQVLRTRAGSLRGFLVGRFVDVLYVQETRFLEVGKQYVVGVGRSKNRLVSKVREATPRFGGDAVIGVNDTDTACPQGEDPIRTLLPDGRAVDSGVFSEMTSSKLRLARATAGPLLVGLALLAGLVLIKQLLFATGRSLRNVMDDETAALAADRRRRPAPMR